VPAAQLDCPLMPMLRARLSLSSNDGRRPLRSEPALPAGVFMRSTAMRLRRIVAGVRVIYFTRNAAVELAMRVLDARLQADSATGRKLKEIRGALEE
jgi:hypothetical protein